MENEIVEYDIYEEYLPINQLHLEKYCSNLMTGIMHWVEVTMKDYTDAQYGKGDIKKLINYDEIKMLQRNV